MKTILCYGDSLTWGYDAEGPSRHALADRWPSVLQAAFGSSVHVIAEGLNGRTTAFDDHLAGADRNGARLLPTILTSHAPLDLVIIMLGANDMKPWIHGNAVAAKQGMQRLVDIVRGHDYPLDEAPPQILLVSPPAVSRTDNAEFKIMFAGGDAASKQLAPLYAALADETGSGFFDAGTIAETTPLDGVHLDAENTRKIGEALVPVSPEDIGPLSMARPRQRIFLSVGRQKDPKHSRFVAKIKEMLETAGLEVNQLPNTFENPLDRVVQELKQSEGALIICFERLYAESAVEFRNSDEPGPQLKPLQAPTIWNHVEAALAKSSNVPVLILAENGCRSDGMLDPQVQFKIHWMDFDVELMSQNYFRQLFHGWIDAVSEHSDTGKPKHIDKVSDLKLMDILRSLKVGEVISVLTFIGTIFGAGMWIGSLKLLGP